MANFTFVFVEMGQGDCTLVQCPDGKVIVIDCGSTNATQVDESAKLEAYLLLRDWTRTQGNAVEALILTHPDADHHNQVVDFFNAAAWEGSLRLASGKTIKNPKGGKVGIKSIYFSYAYAADSPLGNYSGAALNLNVYSHFFGTTAIYEVVNNTVGGKGNVLRRWLAKSNFKKLESETPITGNKVVVGSGKTDGQNWAITILAGNVEKGYGDVDDKATADNAQSLITLFTVGASKALLCGDATLSTEEFLLDAHAATIRNLDLLMVPHHGSAYASGKAFVKATNPKAGVVSVGFLEHSFRLPRYSILSRWLEVIEKNKFKVPYHDIDYWEPCTSDSLQATYEAWVDEKEEFFGNKSNTFFYLSKPGNEVYAIYQLLKSGMQLYRETVNSHLTMTSQKTQVYELSEAGVVLK
jgi:beta-lactamase superfamily II metal-dependent hydrolase